MVVDLQKKKQNQKDILGPTAKQDPGAIVWWQLHKLVSVSCAMLKRTNSANAARLDEKP
jgi:hypothetical protein